MTIEQYLSWFDDVLRTTEDMYHRVPTDKLNWKPTETSFTLGQLIEHMARAIRFNTRVIASEDLPLNSMREILIANRRSPAATPEEATKHLQEYSSIFRQAVRSLGSEKFEHGVVHTPQRGEMPVWRFAIFVLEHHLHHKMELHMYLRLLGVDVNTRTLYGGMAATSPPS